MGGRGLTFSWQIVYNRENTTGNYVFLLNAYHHSLLAQVCRRIDNSPDGTSILERIFAGVGVYYNYTGTVGCFDLDDDPHGMGGWDWQVHFFFF